MLYGAAKLLIGPITRVVSRPVIEGLDNVPKHGPVILAPNHLSFADNIVIPVVVPRKVTFLAKAEYFEGRGLKGLLARWFLGGLGHIPVRRGEGRAAQEALETARGVLEAGGAFGIYPEGTRSRDGRLHRGRTGVARLALTTGAPVVPVALIGTDRLQPIGARVPTPHRVTVRFGRPLTFSRYDGMADSLLIHRTVTDEIMYAILELSGQDYVDSYDRGQDAA